MESRFQISNGSLIKYEGTEKTVVIPDDVKDIGDGAFKKNENIENVIIPDGVTVIGKSAFEGCFHLRHVRLPESLEEISPWAFTACCKLEEIDFSKNHKLRKIGHHAFTGCIGLTELTIPYGLTTIGASAFSGCKYLSKVYLNMTIKSIGKEAFYYCGIAGELKLTGAHLENVGNKAFAENYFLTSVLMPEHLLTPCEFEGIKVGTDIFLGCSRLQEISTYHSFRENYPGNESLKPFAQCYTPKIGCWNVCVVPDPMPGIDSVSFVENEYRAEKFQVPENSIFYSTDERGVLFNKDKTILIKYPAGSRPKDTKYVVPDTVKEIADKAFQFANNLEEIVLPEGLEKIGENAFYCCGNLREIHFPSTLKSVGYSAFTRCPRLRVFDAHLCGKNHFLSSIAFCLNIEDVRISSEIRKLPLADLELFDRLKSITVYFSDPSKASDKIRKFSEDCEEDDFQVSVVPVDSEGLPIKDTVS